MGGIWLDKETQDLLNSWLTRILVLSSFAAHLCLALLAGIRRREGSSWRTNLVWFAYQVTDKAPKVALGKLFLDGPSGDRLPFAFWVPFLLLHLGLPDNISAYSLEDNVLSGRQVLDISLDLGGAFYGAYKQKFFNGDWVLGSAFLIMFFLGFCKYVERAWTLWQAGFDRIRKSNEKKKARRFNTEIERRDNDDVLLLDAHGLLGITMGAFADYTVQTKEKETSPYPYWHDVVKVVEMELSLMYDIMYTKATAIYTWPGYILRLASPPLIAAAFLLFLCHGKAGQNGVDVKITYMLLIGTWLLDVRWLLRALGSTWTYAFLQGTECDLLKETLCCRRGRWYRLRRFIFSIDPRPSLGLRPKEPSGHRAWSRTVGQQNLLRQCTGGTPMKKIGWEGNSGVRSLLEELCRDILKQVKQLPIPKAEGEPEPKEEAMAAVQVIAYDRRRTFGDARRFGPEFDELIITWHIATDVFLLCWPETKKFPDICRKIKALSDYMMFLVAERPEMLPGLKLHSLYENIRDDLKKEWCKVKYDGSSQREEKLARELRRKKTTMIQQRFHSSQLNQTHPNSDLHTMLQEAIVYAEVLERLCLPLHLHQGWNTMVQEVGMEEETEKRLLILVPALQNYAELSEYQKIEKLLCPWTMERGKEHVFKLRYVLECFILKSWVRLLIFASVRCSRDSHAKQLSCGGELTTIIWILAEHSEIVKYRMKMQN